jgi:hypothetical protein
LSLSVLMVSTTAQSSFAGVNMGKIKKLYIGAGDHNNPAKGGTGRIYVDDIHTAKPCGYMIYDP